MNKINDVENQIGGKRAILCGTMGHRGELIFVIFPPVTDREKYLKFEPLGM